MRNELNNEIAISSTHLNDVWTFSSEKGFSANFVFLRHGPFYSCLNWSMRIKLFGTQGASMPVLEYKKLDFKHFCCGHQNFFSSELSFVMVTFLFLRHGSSNFWWPWRRTRLPWRRTGTPLWRIELRVGLFFCSSTSALKYYFDNSRWFVAYNT